MFHPGYFTGLSRARPNGFSLPVFNATHSADASKRPAMTQPKRTRQCRTLISDHRRRICPCQPCLLRNPKMLRHSNGYRRITPSPLKTPYAWRVLYSPLKMRMPESHRCLFQKTHASLRYPIWFVNRHYLDDRSGRSAAWLAHLPWEQGVGRSNRLAPIVWRNQQARALGVNVFSPDSLLVECASSSGG